MMIKLTLGDSTAIYINPFNIIAFYASDKDYELGGSKVDTTGRSWIVMETPEEINALMEKL